jgi:hypothetical protein
LRDKLAFNTGPQYTSQATQLAQVQAKDSFETKSQNYSDPVAYSYAIGDYLLNWRNEASPTPGFNNKLDYIQALLRGSGLSSDTTERGIIGNKDVKALQDVSRIALQNGVPFLNMLQNLYTNKSSAVTFSKSISVAVKLLDPTDAKSTLSDAYFKYYGAFPSTNQISEFEKLYNAEAKRQMAKSTTTTTTSGKVSSSKTTTLGEGFTEKEQQQFLANYLVKNFDVATKENLGGVAKSLYDDIIRTNKNNYLSEPTLPEVASVLKQVLDAPDDKVANELLTNYKNQQRKVASTQYLGIQPFLLAGEDATTYTKPLVDFLTKASGRTISYDDPFIKKALNFKDEKGNYRLMNDLELKNSWMSDPRYATSPGAIQEGVQMANYLTQKLGR